MKRLWKVAGVGAKLPTGQKVLFDLLFLVFTVAGGAKTVRNWKPPLITLNAISGQLVDVGLDAFPRRLSSVAAPAVVVININAAALV